MELIQADPPPNEGETQGPLMILTMIHLSGSILDIFIGEEEEVHPENEVGAAIAYSTCPAQLAQPNTKLR
jgi:hypothetical protein